MRRFCQVERRMTRQVRTDFAAPRHVGFDAPQVYSKALPTHPKLLLYFIGPRPIQILSHLHLAAFCYEAAA